MENNRIVVGIDPGMDTGLAAFCLIRQEIIDIHTIPGGLKGFVSRWKTRPWSPWAVYVERVDPTQPGMPRDTWRIEGYVLGSAESYGRCHFHGDVPPGTHMSQGRPKLERLEGKFGFKFDNRHEVDAASVLVWALQHKHRNMLGKEITECMRPSR